MSEIGVQCEIAHQEHRAAGLDDVEIHLSRVVWEDAEVAYLTGDCRGVLVGVARTDTDVDQQAALDSRDFLCVDGYRRRGYAL